MKALTMRRSPRGGLNLYLALFAVAVGVAAIANSALGAPTKKVYEATITPTATAAPPAFIAAGATATYLLTLTNDRTSQQGLGSADFVAPSGFSAVGATLSSAPAGKNWTANAVGGIVQFRSGSSKDGLAPGESVVAAVTLSAPAATDSAACFPRDDYSWANEVKQSNDFSGTGNDFALGGAKPALTVAKLVVTTPPPHQIVSGATMTPPVVVTAEDGCGTTLVNAPGSVSVAIGVNPGGGTLGGTLSQALNGGTATFPDLSVGPSPAGVGTGYTLVATHASPSFFSQGTSSTFDVVGLICTKTSGVCHADDPNVTTHLDAPNPSGNGALGIGFNDSYGPLAKCGTATGHIGSVAVVDPSNLGAYNVTVTYEKAVSGTGPAAGFQVCLFKPGATDWSAPLQLCSATTPVNTAPCIVSRKRTSNGALQIVLSLTAVDPGIITS